MTVRMWEPASAGPRLAVAVAAALGVLIAAPVIGQIRAAIQDALPGQYRLILLATVALAVGAAVGWALVRIRTRRRSRYGLIGLAVGVGTLFAAVTATGNANVDAVERFHLVEYGLLTLLFYRAWNDRPGLTAFLLPSLAVLLAGTLDEAIQWFVPARVGEWRDVLLNGAAIACGLLFGAALEPPAGRGVRHQADDSGGARLQTDDSGGVRLQTDDSGRARLQADDPGGVRRRADDSGGVRLQADHRLLITMALLTGVTFGAFFYAVHIGHEIHDPAIGSFRSRYDAGRLLALSADRRQRWKVDPPLALRRFSREDQYLAEALWHIQRRNELSGEGGVVATWKENLILEKYFAPALDTPTFATPGGARWPQAQRDNAAAAAAAAAAADQPFVSDAHPFPIYAWSGR